MRKKDELSEDIVTQPKRSDKKDRLLNKEHTVDVNFSQQAENLLRKNPS